MLIDDYREKVARLTTEAIKRAQEAGELGKTEDVAPTIETPRDEGHGDFSTNAAMTLAKPLKKKPREIAEIIAKNIQNPDDFLAAPPSIEGPGFINFRISDHAWRNVIACVVRSDKDYGRSDVGKGEKVLIEFVSANPTGPLHIGHARGAAVGDSMARILQFTGHDVTKEYYVNDAGAQVQILAKSVHARWLEANGGQVDWDNLGDYYPGDYVSNIANNLSAQSIRELKNEKLPRRLPLDFPYEYGFTRTSAVERMLNDIEKDLKGNKDEKGFGVEFDSWFREQELYNSKALEETLAKMEKQGDIYERDGALWFKVSKYEAEEDRVIKKKGGEWTYFASDIAYHKDKLDRGFQRLINVWGADHHGYIGRVRAALKALGFPPDHLQVLLVQMVNLVRNGEPVRMGKRTGEFVTLREVLDEVGADAMRFTFLTRSPDAQLNFDIDALKMKPGEDSEAKMSQLKEKNPVYYVQYAHARSHAIRRKAQESGVDLSVINKADLDLLTKAEEIALAKKMERFPREIAQAALDAEPHRISHYLLDLAGDFHRYYYKGDKDKSYRVLSAEAPVAQARLALVTAAATVIRNGLNLLGVSAPERM